MARHPVRFGIQTGQQNVDFADMLALWRNADAWGYDSLWAFDHFSPIFTNPDGPCLAAWTTLAALAQATTRARVGHLVIGNTYRHPCVTAKAPATVDHVSGGRLNLGIGAGWFEQEHAAFGIDFKTVPGRLAALEEACRIIKGMFTTERTTVHGTHYHVTDALGLPKPVQAGGPPLMIGGTGQKVLLRIVARHADMWNATGSPAQLGELIGVIDRHGEAVGRDTRAIEKTVMMPLCYTEDRDRQAMMCSLFASVRQTTPEEARKAIMIGGKQECLDAIGGYVAAGVTHFISMSFVPYNADEMQGFIEDVAPAARAA
jgi:F420-dependent oxidoreductase-like protein